MSRELVKAAVLTSWEKIEIREYPYPKVGDYGLLSKTIMSGVCGTDKHIFDGKLPEMKLPTILGHENLGRIEEIGSEAAATMEVHGVPLKKGDRVTWFGGAPCGKCWYCRWLPSNHPSFLCENPIGYWGKTCDEPPHLFGGFAEYQCVHPKASVFKIPDELPDDVAILTDIFASVGGIKMGMQPYPAVNEGFGPGGTIIIQGSGPIGIAAGITAWLFGAYKIILIGGPEHRLNLARGMGVFDEIISIDKYLGTKERVRRAVESTPGGVGADMVVECAGVPTAVPEGLEMVRRGGTFVEIGAFTDVGTTVISPFKHICHKNVTIIGQYGCSAQYYDDALKFVHMAWKRGVPLNKLVTHRFTIEETAEAIQAHKKLVCMKAVIVPSE